MACAGDSPTTSMKKGLKKRAPDTPEADGHRREEDGCGKHPPKTEHCFHHRGVNSSIHPPCMPPSYPRHDLRQPRALLARCGTGLCRQLFPEECYS